MPLNVDCCICIRSLGIGPCSIEAHWKFCDSQECSAIDRTGTWARAEGPTAAAWSQCGGKKWRPESSVFHFVGCTGVTSGHSSPLMMFDEETEKEPCFCWWCISLCREPPSVQMAAWWKSDWKATLVTECHFMRGLFIVMLIRQSPSARAGLLFFPIDLNLFVFCCVGSFCWTRHAKFLQLHKHCKVSLEVSLTVCFFSCGSMDG